MSITLTDGDVSRKKKTTMFSTVFVVFMNGWFLLVVAALPVVLYDIGMGY